jgi:hypothetical protein
MVAYVLAGGRDELFDPAVGAGAFFLAARTIASETGRTVTLTGTEIDPDALRQARQKGLSEAELAHVHVADFLMNPPRGPFRAIVGNPPYLRHHRLPPDLKSQLKVFAANLLGAALDGRAGLHVYFLLQALKFLDADGRLAFIMPADTCEGVFAPKLWSWITKRYRLEAVVTFNPEASPFPEVDTNPLIFMIRNAEPQGHFLWARCTEAGTGELRAWALSGLGRTPTHGLSVRPRALSEGLTTGLSRPPLEQEAGAPTLGQFAAVMRGIATGANDFFFLTAQRAARLGIPEEFLIRAVGRTRDVRGDQLDFETIRSLETAGRPTLLFSPDDRPLHELPVSVREYLNRGEAMGLAQKPLISSRQPWYKMEVREPPPILFAYLGRRNARFILNTARVVPLTGFLCVYPYDTHAAFIRSLWRILRDPETIANLSLVGKSYGAGAVKVEPRALEKLPLPAGAVAREQLTPRPQARQLQLCCDKGRLAYSSGDEGRTGPCPDRGRVRLPVGKRRDEAAPETRSAPAARTRRRRRPRSI